jgi:PAS domain S-box-containing protein
MARLLPIIKPSNWLLGGRALASDSQGGPPHPNDPEDALHEQREWLRVTLSSIGDAVISTDVRGNVTFLNHMAETLTGWSSDDACGTSLDAVYKIVNEATRETAENPATRTLREGLVLGLANHTLLIAKDGTERLIEDSAAPVRNRQGEISGVVLIFRDITERRRAEQAVQDGLDYADNIIATLRHPFLVVLDKDLRVVTANRSFYRTFHVSAEETESRLVYELGSHQWDIPALRKLLEDILPTKHAFQDFEVEHDFPSIGRKIMLLNARRIERVNHDNQRAELILLAIEDITERRAMEAKLQASEVRYRRLFESAQDGILLLHLDTGVITDANPFMTELLGYSHDELIGKELWEIGLFKDAAESRGAFQVLQERGYIRYSHLPLKTRTSRRSKSSLSATCIRRTTSLSSNATFEITRHIVKWSWRCYRPKQWPT